MPKYKCLNCKSEVNTISFPCQCGKSKWVELPMTLIKEEIDNVISSGGPVDGNLIDKWFHQCGYCGIIYNTGLKDQCPLCSLKDNLMG